MTHPASDGSQHRQPVHTVYGGAHLFSADAAGRLGALARQALAEYASDAPALAAAFELPPTLAARIYPRSSPSSRASRSRTSASISRMDSATARTTRRIASRGARRKRWPEGTREEACLAGIGIRIKNLGDELKRRSLRTFDLFLSTLLDRTGGVLPGNFVVTLPKITAPEQVGAMADACSSVRGVASPGGRHAEVRADDRDDPVDHRERWNDRSSPAHCHGTGPDRRRALRHLRLHGSAEASPLRTST